jgi:cell division protease FtsH
MVTRYGMDESLGNLSYHDEPSPLLPIGGALTERRYSEETATKIDESVRAISNAAFDRAVSILTSHRKLLETGAQMLLSKETLSESEIAALTASLRSDVPLAANGANA